MSRIILLSGSQRKESFNTRLLEHLILGLAGYAEIDMIPAQEINLPVFNQDLEHEVSVSAEVEALHARFQKADGLIIASPEFNRLPSPFLKNTLDWISRQAYIKPHMQNPFHNLPVLLCSVSTGWSGGAMGLAALRNMLAYLGALVSGEQICVPHGHQNWNGNSFEFDPVYDGIIFSILERFVTLVIQLSSEEILYAN